MNDFSFCPNCGHKVKLDAQFCPNCGYQFNTNSSSIDEQKIENNSFNNNSQLTRQQNNNTTKITWIIVIIIAIIGCAVGYKYLMPHKSNHPKSEVVKSSESSSNSSSSISSKNDSDNSNSNDTNALTSYGAQETLSDVFSAVGQSVEDSDDAPDYSQSFINGEANSSYQALASWAHLQSQNSNIDGVDINIEDFKLSGNNATFKAAYDFDNGDHHHIQVYVWNVTFKNQDDNWLILSCKSNNKAVADYDR